MRPREPGGCVGINVYIPREMKVELEVEAREVSLSLSDYVRGILECRGQVVEEPVRVHHG